MEDALPLDEVRDQLSDYQTSDWYHDLGRPKQRLVDETVESIVDQNLGSTVINYSIDKRPATKWNMLLGARWEINKNFEMRAEAGFLGRTSVLVNAVYRFPILSSTASNQFFPSLKCCTFGLMSKRLPIGIQSFRKLIEEGYLYVDKTEVIHRLFSAGKYYFLARPRRFGKSLLVSTLKEVFLGSQELFKGLWIYDQIEWESHAVIHLDFNSITSPDTPLEDGISSALEEIAAQYEIRLSERHYSLQFKELIQLLGKEKKVAILIDEYDKPIVEYIDASETAERNQEVLRNFYRMIKSNDAYIHFFFLTGIAKFTKDSIFSDLNNIADITFNKKFGDIAGYTQSELEHYFKEEISELGKTYEEVYPDILSTIKTWYNGYSWDGINRVYNPFSILNLFFAETFGDYWFATGTPSFLIKLFQSQNYHLTDLQMVKLFSSDFNAFELETLDVSILLFQTGYLTVKEYDFSNRMYTLGFPNREVEFAFSRHLLRAHTPQKPNAAPALLVQIKEAFLEADIPLLINLLEAIFADIVYPINTNVGDTLQEKERFYHSHFLVILKLLGVDIAPEVLTYNGRIDAVIQTPERVFIIEFKVGSAKEALRQIEEKKYHLKYLPLQKRITLLGIGFDVEQKNISGYESLDL